MLQRTIRLPHPIDVHATWHGLRRGRHDPTCRSGADGIWRATRSPGGASTLRLVPDGDRIEATAWGDGADAILDIVPDLVGATDHVDAFHPDHPVVERLWREHRDVRIPRAHAVSEVLIANVLEQRVTIFEARRAQAQIARTWGEPAPGPTDLYLPVDPDVLAGIPYYDLHVCGVERFRADAVQRVAATAGRLDKLVDVPLAEATDRLVDIPGVGPWSAAHTALIALGDADAVPLGDAHLPADVTWALTGEAVDDDETMLEVLSPFAGQRGRVIRLIGAAGLRAPRQAPRYAPRDLRAE